VCGGDTVYYTQCNGHPPGPRSLLYTCFVRQHARMHSHAHMCRCADDEGYLAATASKHDTRARKPFQAVVCVHKTHAHLHAVFIQPATLRLSRVGRTDAQWRRMSGLCRRRLLGKRFKFKRVNGLSGRPLIHERTQGISIRQPVVLSVLSHLSNVEPSVCYVIPQQCIQQLLLIKM